MSINEVLKATHVLVKQFQLKGIKRIDIKFDPFFKSIKSVRNFLFYVSSPRVRQSNTKCVLKTSVVNDRSEPTVCVTIDSGHKYLLRTGNLTTLEVVEEFSKIIKKCAPPEPTEGPTLYKR